MDRNSLFAVAGLVILLALGTQTVAQTPKGKIMGLPVGSEPTCATKGVGFLSTWFTRGRFSGIRIVSVVPGTTNVTITSQYGGGAVLYDGPVSPGQYIPLSTTKTIWKACKSTGGRHESGIRVQHMFTGL